MGVLLGVFLGWVGVLRVVVIVCSILLLRWVLLMGLCVFCLFVGVLVLLVVLCLFF